MNLRLVLGATAALLALGSASLAQTASPWNGSWKMDLSTEHFEGSSFSVAVTPAGFTVTRLGKAAPAVVCDGKPHNGTSAGTTYVCAKAPAGYHFTYSRDGKTTGTATITVAGSTMTRKQDFSGPPPSSITSVSKRISGGPGSAGVWKTVAVRESMVDPLTVAIHGDSIDFKETDQPKPVTAKLDGSETKLPDIGTVAIKLVDPHTLKVVYRTDGKIRRENTFVLSPDGKTISETDFTPDPGASTQTMLLHRM